MSAPRQIIEGTTWLITRRCIERRFYLRPDATTNRIIGYALARAAQETNVILHAYVFMSNHYHLVVTDPDGTLPVFMQRLNSLLARALNARYQRWGYFWEGSAYGAAALTTEAAMWDALVYTLTNPVAAGLVRYHQRWPGVVASCRFGDRRRWEKPAIFFREQGLPTALTLTTEAPTGLGEPTHVARQLKALVTQTEGDLHAALRRRGQRVLGRKAVQRQDPFDAPTTPTPRRRLNPRLAAKNPSAMLAARQALRAFYAAYRTALQAFVGGRREVRFPEGTYLMVHRFGVACHGPSG